MDMDKLKEDIKLRNSLKGKEREQKLYNQGWVEEDCDAEYEMNVSLDVFDNYCKDCIGWRRRLVSFTLDGKEITRKEVDFKVNLDGEEKFCAKREVWKQLMTTRAETIGEVFTDEIGQELGKIYKEDSKMWDEIRKLEIKNGVAEYGRCDECGNTQGYECVGCNNFVGYKWFKGVKVFNTYKELCDFLDIVPAPRGEKRKIQVVELKKRYELEQRTDKRWKIKYIPKKERKEK